MTSPKNYISREEIDWKIAEDETYLEEMLGRQKELREKLGPIVGELRNLRVRIEQTEKSISDWSEREPG
ncbi:MAG: hypothetical protein KDB66_05330 [Solirubrobacterales bacterium]|nr:hypothetical protein [Solirubrobacterales bacterium]